VRDQLRALAKLAEIDGSARELDQELREIPARVDGMRLDVQRLESLLAAERGQLAEAERLDRVHHEDLASRNDQLSKARGKTAKAKNAREAEAAEREVEAVRRGIRERDDEHLKLAEAIEKVKASLGEHEKEFENLKSLFREEETKAAGRIAELEVERGKVLQGRDAIVARLPRPIASRYQRIRDQRGVAVAEVVDGTCKGCRMQIPAQQYNVLRRGETIEQCAACQRIIFHRQVIED